MSVELLTFGEFLGSVMKSKNISVTRLAELTGMKSRNSIQRLLKDESSINVIEAFKAKLVELDPLRLSASELEQLEQSIEVSRVGKDTLGARKILKQVFDNRNNKVKPGSPAVLNPYDHKSISLDELFDTYKNFTKIRMLIFDSISAEFTNELVNLIRTSPHASISISQILYLGNSRSHTAANFASVFKLFNYQHYDVYNVSNHQTLYSRPCISSNSIIINKETAEGHHYTDLIQMQMDTDHGFSYIKDVPGNSLYYFYLYHFDRIKKNCQNIRRTYEKKNPLETVLSIYDICLPLEKNSSRYIVKHSFSSTMIPYDILLNILIEADYYGLDEKSPVIQKLKQVFYNRLYFFFHTDKLKINFLTKRGLLDFAKNRVTTDHFCKARPFTKEEVKTILEYILKKLEDNENFKILLLKDDYSIGNIEFSYYENEALWIFDSCSGYGADYYDGFIDSAPILDVFDDFIKNELLKNHTLPESETVDFLKYLISIV